MGIGTTLAVVGGTLGAAGIGAAGSLGAAKTQAGASQQAAQLQYLSSQQALDFQKQQWAQQQQNIAPWLQSGQGALGNLNWLLGVTPAGTQYSPTPQMAGGGGWGGVSPGGYSAAPGMSTALTGNVPPTQAPTLMAPTSRMMTQGGGSQQQLQQMKNQASAGAGAGITPTVGGLPAGTNRGNVPGAAQNFGQPGSFGSLMQGWNQPFVPPTGATEQNDPGYQFRISQGLQALQNSAAARGGLLSGNTAQAIEQYAQDYASNEYQNVYNRSLGQYQQAYNIFQQNQANQFNRLASLAGVGQTATGQLASAGTAAAGNVGNILLGSSAQIGQSLQNAGAARASGYAGVANAIGGGVGNLGQLALLNALYP